ncbi:thiamine phosphate synthase [Salibacterium aidingense]|uniref:thiamine phosphate synthase n=1 Tax=Salibacterium aidingense TaxID=384933 RepID=UPI003BC32149
MNKQSLRLYFIMGSTNTNKDPETVLKEAVQGGITCFQFREKGEGARTGEEKKRLAVQLQKLCHKSGIPFIVNDDVDLALDIQADGIHVGQKDVPLAEVKKRCPGTMIIGVSAKTREEAEKAVQDGADYLGVGPMFGTTTKEDAEAPIGPQAIRHLRQEGITIPMVGIGGIDEINAGEVIEAGADGVSVISAISRAVDGTQAAAFLKKAVHG